MGENNINSADMQVSGIVLNSCLKTIENFGRSFTSRELSL